MTTPLITIDISVEDARWRDMFPTYETTLEKTLNSAADHLNNYTNKNIENTEISILLANNNIIKQLNHEHRGKDKPTNILSFPMTGEFTHGCLGDLALGLEIILEEADAQHKTPHDHLTHLIIHGFLHLLGYDHIDDAEAEEMEALEVKILGDMGINNPYEAPQTVP